MPIDCRQIADCCNASLQGSKPLAETLKLYAPVGALGLSAFTFWLGYRQKERDRTSGYYQKVVVDEVLPEIINFTRKFLESLDQLAISVSERPRNARKTTPRNVTKELAIFSQELFELGDKLLERTALFDVKTSLKMELLFEQFQDEVTKWFEEAGVGKRRDRAELRKLIQSGQQRIVKELYRGKVRNF